MVNWYRERYYGGEEEETKFFQDLKADWGGGSDDDESPFKNDGVFSADTLRGYYERVLTHMDTKENELDLAKELELQIKAATSSEKSKTKQNRKKINDML